MNEIEDHDRGLAFDLPRLITRRRALGVLAGSLTTAAIAACGGSSSSVLDRGASDTTGEHPRGDRRPVPGRRLQRAERARPRAASCAATSRKSFGDASGVAAGVPTTVELTLLDVAGGGDGAGRRRRLSLALHHATARTRSTTRASPARTTCAACRRPTRTAS